MIVDLTGPEDPLWDRALPVLQELRPQLTRLELVQILVRAAGQGLRFTAVIDDDQCVAVAGWRIMDTTSVGRKLYVDDLATRASDRSRGYGGQLLAELTRRARDEYNCRTIELDSGVQRFSAHRFYLRERMQISSHHFSRRLD